MVGNGPVAICQAERILVLFPSTLQQDNLYTYICMGWDMQELVISLVPRYHTSLLEEVIHNCFR